MQAKSGSGSQSSRRLSEEEFVRRAILNLRTEGHKGIHAVYSGFNNAFRQYFGTDPVKAMERLEKAGKVVTRPAKGGATLYLPSEAPGPRPTADKVLGKILS